MQFERRFGGLARLYGEAALDRFAAARVTVVGLGGVGSWVAEALARSGVGGLRLIDLDHVAESNINRQLPALESTLGRAKVQVMAERILEINADCQVAAVEAFVEADAPGRELGEIDAPVIDCIDNYRIKAALIAHCRRLRLPVVTVGGAGGRRDPTRIQVSDLAKSRGDALLSRTRRSLRSQYGFPSNPKRRFEVRAVWSDEAPVWPTQYCQTATPLGAGLHCGGLGSAVTVTAAFGLIAAAQMLEYLSRGREPAQPGSATIDGLASEDSGSTEKH